MNQIEYTTIQLYGAGDAIYCGKIKHSWLDMFRHVGQLSIF